MPSKIRADQLTHSQGLADSRSKAQALIMAGKIYAGDRRVEKAGQMLPEETQLILKGKDHPWVSRGGQKLDGALKEFDIPIGGKVALDVGASTGGFVDVLLHYGASQVYAVDVGHGQLAWKLREDDRVVVLEKTNARYLTKDQIDTSPQIVTCDASFISLKTVLPAALSLAETGAYLIALIKPQFEAGKGQVGKGGVVRDPALHESICADIRQWVQNEMKWNVMGITQSSILGPEGNKEFLIVAHKGSS